MTSRTLLPFFALLALTAGCLGKTTTDEGASGSELSEESSPEKKPTPRNDKDGPVACPPVAPPECPAGQRVADTNGDGCALECEIVSCPPVIPTCPPGHRVADTDGDGCALECEPVACPPYVPTCAPGEKIADADGDGCAAECVPE
ncbi:MAG: hypothetical protein KF819_04180 [Labilithrix sp.]|nr:hypothetical protein [Labilithrix sp.]